MKPQTHEKSAVPPQRPYQEVGVMLREMIAGQQAQEALSSAHHVQTKLIEMDEGTGKIPVHLVMVHAQDHLMNAIMLMELGREIIALHQQFAH